MYFAPVDSLIASISLSAAFVALCFSGVSLILHFIRRRQPPEVSELWTAVQEARTQHLDLLDKVEHWRRRDSVRRARQGAEDKQQVAASEDQTPADYKKELRRRVAASGMSMAGARE